MVDDRVLGVLLGTALGDAAGLPFEGMAPGRIARRLERHPLVPSLIAGRALVSDDTEHTCHVARALAMASDGAAINGAIDVPHFERALARALKRWLVTLPPAIGFGTLRGLMRLWLGWSPATSGVASAGNGPAMRAALLGVVARDDDQLRALVRAATRMTHGDPRAEDAVAVVIARAARRGGGGEIGPAVLVELGDAAATPELRDALTRAGDLIGGGASMPMIVAAMGWQRGVSGYAIDTAAAALATWVHVRRSPAEVIEAAVRLGGDTDTVGAIAGAVAGAEHGAVAMPPLWIARLRDWPVTVAHLHALARAVTDGEAPPPARLLCAMARNAWFLLACVVHVGRRLTWR